jgi:hypothetical protein
MTDIDPRTHIPYATEGLPPYELVAFDGPPKLLEFPSDMRDRVMIDTIHDGCIIPSPFLRDLADNPIDPQQLSKHHNLERDWGANLVAEQVARYLNLPGYYRVNIARVLMDFGRFPGMTPRNAPHLQRYAINYPFSGLLSYQQKRQVLETCYDPISSQIERHIRNKLVKIAIHTYDTYNSSGTIRPPTSLVSRSVNYQHHSEMPIGVFDPLFPDILAEFTADRILRDRLSLTLERAHIPAAHNYPYCLPEGSIEVRTQVWFFFLYIRRHFEAAFPDTASDPAFERVWSMLMDTNLRNSESETLRSYLHMFRHAPDGLHAEYAQARLAYEHVKAFIDHDNRHIVRAYRSSPDRPSAIGIEVRKDLLWEFDTHGAPIRPKLDMVAHIGTILGRAILTYLTEDRPLQLASQRDIPLTDPWFVEEARASNPEPDL